MTAKTAPAKYNEILCVGLGLSGVCLAIQLKRKLGVKDMHFYDRNPCPSGTWWSNQYPGAACDIPAVYYSFSFEQNPTWTKLLPSHDEIRKYVEGVVDKYQIRQYMTFRTECESARWDNKRHIWTVHLRNLETGERHVHECRILFSAVGQLVDPKEFKIPGRETFEGPIFHTARWMDDVDLANKHVIVIGNGCSGSQVVPQIAPKTKTLTNFIHTPHWLMEIENTRFGPGAQWAFRNIPLLGRFMRLAIFIWAENWWRLFPMTKSGARLRRATEKQSKEYILGLAPKKYHDMLIPDWEIACKRRVFDADGLYLKSLHAPNVELTKESIIEVLPRGVRTETKTYPADVIVLATGFQTNNGLGPLRIQGRDGVWLNDHWQQMGGPAAYNSTAVHGFPNFFMLYGPNSNTGHNSVILTSENVIDHVLKVIKPLIQGEASEVEVKGDAEKEYSTRVQAASKTRVFYTCSNWYVTADGWNAVMYPWSQIHFWWRCIFPTWRDWSYKYTARHARRVNLRRTILTLFFTLGLIGATASWSGAQWLSNLVELASEYLQKGRSSFNI